MSLLINPYRFAAPAGGSAAVSVHDTFASVSSGTTSTLDRGSGTMAYLVCHSGNRDMAVPTGPTQFSPNLLNNHATAGTGDAELLACYWTSAPGAGTDLTFTSVSEGTSTPASAVHAAVALAITAGTIDTGSVVEVVDWTSTTTLHTIPAVSGLAAGDLVVVAVAYATQDGSAVTSPCDDVAGPYTQLGSSVIGAGVWDVGIDIFTASPTGGNVASEDFTSSGGASGHQVSIFQFVVSAP